MKKFLNIFFVTLGVIFLIQIIFMVYFYITDPLNLKPLFFGPDNEEVVAEEADINTGDVVDKHPLLDESQEKALETVGIDPANVPTEITSEQKQCLEEAVGAERAEEIKTGASPTAAEIFRARECL